MPTEHRFDRDHFTLSLMLALTFSTGIIDAVGYLGLDRVFTGNMTGNVVLLGAALTGATSLPIIGPVLALAGFMLGAVIGGRALNRRSKGWSGAAGVMLLVVGAGLTTITVLLLVFGDKPPPGLALPITGGLGLMMGCQAATARKIGVSDVTTVVVTSTITGLAADSWLGGGDRQKWFRRLAAIVLIGGGAAAGALLLSVHLAYAVALSALITVLVALAGHLSHRGYSRQGDRRSLGSSE